MTDIDLEVPGTHFTHGLMPTHESAITRLEETIAFYRRGMMTGDECMLEIDEIAEGHRAERKSSVWRPSNPMWNCCVERPAAVMRFDDGSATVVCRSCSTTVGKTRIFDLPDGWFPNPAEQD